MRSPGRQRDTLAPTRSTVPASSRPRMSEAPGGGGYLPCRCMRSGRLTPAASTRTRSSAGPGSGVAPTPATRTSGGPGTDIVTIRMTQPTLPCRSDARGPSTAECERVGESGSDGYPGRQLGQWIRRQADDAGLVRDGRLERVAADAGDFPVGEMRGERAQCLPHGVATQRLTMT